MRATVSDCRPLYSREELAEGPPGTFAFNRRGWIPRAVMRGSRKQYFDEAAEGLGDILTVAMPIAPVAR